MIEEARSMASKQFTLFSAEETQQFDNPTSCLRHVLDKVIFGISCDMSVVYKYAHPFNMKIKMTRGALKGRLHIARSLLHFI